MGKTTLATQLVSILRAKLWTVDMKRKKFFNFLALFLKMYLLEIAKFSLALVLIRLTQFYQ